jgi:hypothetical protein
MDDEAVLMTVLAEIRAEVTTSEGGTVEHYGEEEVEDLR